MLLTLKLLRGKLDYIAITTLKDYVYLHIYRADELDPVNIEAYLCIAEQEQDKRAKEKTS